MIRYYFLVASQAFLFYQEPVEEILRERMNHYSSLKKEIDFCFTSNLDFLNMPELNSVKQKITSPSAAIISLNPRFIDWLKLRIQYGVTGSFAAPVAISYNKLFSKKF